MLTQIAEIITTETRRFIGEETVANAMRCAAQFAHDDFPAATARDFGDAAASLGLHRQGAMNRWNEAKANCGDLW